METERMALSQRERDRLRVLQDVEQGHLTQVEAAGRIHLCEPSGASAVAAPAGARRPGDAPRITRTALEPQVRGYLRGRRFWHGYVNAMRISDPRSPPSTWPRRVTREPGDAAEVDDPAAFWRPRSQRVEKDPRVAPAPGQFRELVMQIAPRSVGWRIAAQLVNLIALIDDATSRIWPVSPNTTPRKRTCNAGGMVATLRTPFGPLHR